MGGGLAGRVAGRNARTAATFSGFLPLEVALPLDVAAFFGATFLLAVFRGAFATDFLVFAAARFGGAAFFGDGFAFAELFLAAALATVARFALTFEAGFAFTARFAAFEEVRFAAVRAVDRRKPFERLLLILVLIYKGCSAMLSSRGIGAQLSTALRLNQSTQLFAGALSRRSTVRMSIKSINKKNT